MAQVPNSTLTKKSSFTSTQSWGYSEGNSDNPLWRAVKYNLFLIHNKCYPFAYFNIIYREKEAEVVREKHNFFIFALVIEQSIL